MHQRIVSLALMLSFAMVTCQLQAMQCMEWLFGRQTTTVVTGTQAALNAGWKENPVRMDHNWEGIGQNRFCNRHVAVVGDLEKYRSDKLLWGATANLFCCTVLSAISSPFLWLSLRELVTLWYGWPQSFIGAPSNLQNSVNANGKEGIYSFSVPLFSVSAGLFSLFSVCARYQYLLYRTKMAALRNLDADVLAIHQECDCLIRRQQPASASNQLVTIENSDKKDDNQRVNVVIEAVE